VNGNTFGRFFVYISVLNLSLRRSIFSRPTLLETLLGLSIEYVNGDNGRDMRGFLVGLRGREIGGGELNNVLLSPRELDAYPSK
jgi:hypothetical protein